MSGLRTRPHVSPFGRAMDAMHVTARTPNEQVLGEMTGWYAVRIAVAHGYAERVGDAEMATQLTRVARLLFAARQKEYHRLVEIHLQPTPGPLSPRRQAFRDVLDRSAVTGSAADGRVEVTSIGLTEWSVRVAPGTTDRLGGEGLGIAATAAANQLAEEWVGLVHRLKAARREERAT